MARKINCEIQPYLLIEGNKTNVKNIYIVLDKIHFKCDSTLKGIDILFKCFFALNIKYPPQSEHIWTIIERGLFKINVTEKSLPYIDDIIAVFKDDFI